MQSLLLWLLICVTPEQYERIRQSTYLGANQIRYFDAVAVGPDKLLTAVIVTPEQYRDDVLWLRQHPDYGFQTWGWNAGQSRGVQVVWPEDALPVWVDTNRTVRRGDTVLAVSIKQNFRQYCRVTEVGDHRFRVNFKYGNSGCGVYNAAGQLCGVWWGYIGNEGIVMRIPRE